MKLVPNAVSSKVGRQMLRIDRSSPTLLFGVGIVGMVGTTVLASRATLKLSETLHEAKHDLDIAKSISHRKYEEAEESRRKDVAIIYTRSAVKIARLYAPAVIVGGVSIACLTKSHQILNDRNLALTAAYAALDKGFHEYRSRVIEKYGEDADREFRYDTETVEVLDEKGKLVEEVRVGPGGASIYARFFDQLSPVWDKNPEYNMAYLRCQQSYANHMLVARGHVFLNEVYDSLGLDRTKAGAVVGWILSDDSDNYIDFGVFTGDNQSRSFVNGREGSILLDFNVDGVIFDKIDAHDRREIGWQS